MKGDADYLEGYVYSTCIASINLVASTAPPPADYSSLTKR